MTTAPAPGEFDGRIRLGMVGGGVGSFMGDVHRAAARLDGMFDLVFVIRHFADGLAQRLSSVGVLSVSSLLALSGLDGLSVAAAPLPMAKP